MDGRKLIAFFSVPLPGHVNPLIAQAVELRRRGHLVAILSCASARAHVESQLVAVEALLPLNDDDGDDADLPPAVAFVSVGACTSRDETLSVFGRIARLPDFLAGSQEALQWTTSLWPCLFDGGVAALRALPASQRPHLLVVDALSPAGVDVAEAVGLPYMINNADLLNLLSPAVVPPVDFIPGMFRLVAREWCLICSCLLLQSFNEK
jgi:hypothetical protein